MAARPGLVLGALAFVKLDVDCDADIPFRVILGYGQSAVLTRWYVEGIYLASVDV